MYTKSFQLYVACLLVALLVVIGLMAPIRPPAQAALISQADVDSQRREVMLSIVDVLEQHLKLLQMIYITRLETQVTQLQARVNEQSP